MIGSSDNSGGVVVGTLACGTECSGFKSCFMLVNIFLSSHRIGRAIPTQSQYSMLQAIFVCLSKPFLCSSSFQIHAHLLQ